MPSTTKISINLKKLDQLSDNLKKKYVAKVGILGKTANRSGSQSNADIGAIHEFGSFSNNIPRRSFLRDSFILNQKEFEEKVGNIIDKNLDNPDAFKRIFNLIGAYGSALVQQAFATSGFGRWKPLSKFTVKKKGSSAILIDTAQLRKSITWSVEKR